MHATMAFILVFILEIITNFNAKLAESSSQIVGESQATLDLHGARRSHIPTMPRLTAGRLLWEILESIDGVEGVTGASALDGGLGFEFLLKLRTETTLVRELKSRIQQAEISMASDGKLHVTWAQESTPVHPQPMSGAPLLSAGEPALGPATHMSEGLDQAAPVAP